jgi:hypothetical protein
VSGGLSTGFYCTCDADRGWFPVPLPNEEQPLPAIGLQEAGVACTGPPGSLGQPDPSAPPANLPTDAAATPPFAPGPPPPLSALSCSELRAEGLLPEGQPDVWGSAAVCGLSAVAYNPATPTRPACPFPTSLVAAAEMCGAVGARLCSTEVSVEPFT